jgi:lipid-A-disaccharide synthase
LDIMHAMDAGLAASGTVTLELALAGKPFAIAYRVSAPVYAAGKLLVRLPYFAPVNLVAEREVVREFIGVRSPAAALAGELARLQAKDSAETMSAALEEVRARLGPVGASARAAAEVAAFLD